MNKRFCPHSGKEMFRTRAPAEKAVARLGRVNHTLMGSVYLCRVCGQYHITHWGYEVQESIDRQFPVQKPTKKQLRSQRRKKKRLWYPPIPLRTEIRSIKQFFTRPDTMTKEEKIKIWESEPVRMARLKMELSYILADVMDTYMREATNIMERNAINFNGNEKRKWNTLVDFATKLKQASKQVASAVYEADLVDEACEESDLMADLLLTIAQRVNDMNRDTMEQTYRLMKATIQKHFQNLYIEHKTNI